MYFIPASDQGAQFQHPDGTVDANWTDGGVAHRIDGPATISATPTGTVCLQWRTNGTPHRLDGPASITHAAHMQFIEWITDGNTLTEIASYPSARPT